MEYTDFGFKNSPPYTTDLQRKWINTHRKLRYLNVWPKRKTTLIQKDPLKWTASNNYRPITCLPMMGKILTTQIREQIYYSLISRGIFPDEQKGCRKGITGSYELLYIDQLILNESKTKWKYLPMAWIDYKKTYGDMVHQTWLKRGNLKRETESLILHCLKMYKIPDQVVQFIYANQESEIECWRKKLSRGKDPKRHIPGKCTLTMTIGDSHDATQPHH